MFFIHTNTLDTSMNDLKIIPSNFSLYVYKVFGMDRVSCNSLEATEDHSSTYPFALKRTCSVRQLRIASNKASQSKAVYKRNQRGNLKVRARIKALTVILNEVYIYSSLP